jgi:hypothetical protein
MPRSLSASVITELATNKLNPVELVYLGIGAGTYYTDHYKDLTYDGNTYTASSLFLGSSEVQETADVAVNNLTFKILRCRYYNHKSFVEQQLYEQTSKSL